MYEDMVPLSPAFPRFRATMRQDGSQPTPSQVHGSYRGAPVLSHCHVPDKAVGRGLKPAASWHIAVFWTGSEEHARPARSSAPAATSTRSISQRRWYRCSAVVSTSRFFLAACIRSLARTIHTVGQRNHLCWLSSPRCVLCACVVCLPVAALPLLVLLLYCKRNLQRTPPSLP